MSKVPGKFALTSEVMIQTRRAQAVDARLAEAVRRTCVASEYIAACYLLDARKPETGEMALIIALTLDDEAARMDLVAQQFQTMLREFPAQASNTFIMSSARFAHDYAGAEFYVRTAKG
jgi:hypothetical protein